MAAAAKEQRALDAIVAAIPPDRPLGNGNTAKKTTALSAKVLAGEIASAKNDHKLAEQDFAEAVAMQDALVYEEPPLWYFPVRERLGAELFAQGQPQSAEAIYRADLKVNPGNPRSLYGLSQCLEAEGKKDEAAKYKAQFKDAWRYADVEIEPLRVAASASHGETDQASADGR